jgi:hypothetical protein
MTHLDFATISIRARVAFAILCLESAVEKISKKNPTWEIVFTKLWAFTSIAHVDEWLYQISIVMPSSILEDTYEENKEISLADFNSLKSLYLKTESVIFEILECVFECGTIELYSKVTNHSPRTLAVMEKLTALMIKNQIPMPDINSLLKFPFTENGGWGRPFRKDEISKEPNRPV